MGAPTPPGRWKKFRRNLQGKCVSARPRTRSAPQPEQEPILGHSLLGGLDFEVYLDRLMRATTKKGQLFWRKKCTPDKILTTPMGVWKRAKPRSWRKKWQFRQRTQLFSWVSNCQRLGHTVEVPFPKFYTRSWVVWLHRDSASVTRIIHKQRARFTRRIIVSALLAVSLLVTRNARQNVMHYGTDTNRPALSLVDCNQSVNLFRSNGAAVRWTAMTQ